MNKQEITEKGLELVSYSGDARADYLWAIKLAKEGRVEEARIKISEADQMLADAHIAQTELLQEEARGNYSDVTMMMVHGQDHLMTTVLLKDLVTTIVDLCEKIFTN